MKPAVNGKAGNSSKRYSTQMISKSSICTKVPVMPTG